MDRVRVLCAMDQYMMCEFSKRTSASLKEHSLFRLILPPFQSFLDVNVKKEEEKDRSVISTAYCALQEKTPIGEIPIAPLLQKARKIDRKFLQQTSVLPISIDIQYRDIEQVRRQRMEMLLHTAYQLFQQWENTPRIRTAFSNIFSQEQFSQLLGRVLHLYNLETEILSHSIRLPRLMSMARDRLSQTVYHVMENVSKQLVTELSSIVYRRIN